MSDETRVKSTIYVTGLDPTTTTPSTVHSFFLPFGPIVDIHLPLEKSTSLPKGFAYVEFTEPQDASSAIDNFDQAELFGRVIRVSQAKNLGFREGNSAGRVDGGLGSKVAVWEQEGWLKKYEVDEEDRKVVEGARKGAGGSGGGSGDPMEGLEGLDVAGPKLKG
ncbi:hypothetical protein TWF718_009550 [Orbilia javanica]|uniref:RRM domain-containing protein n=1 Tax=Orbilia javanica TaxID=47235 RepID=A0AAN8RET7_9PEZI